MMTNHSAIVTLRWFVSLDVQDVDETMRKLAHDAAIRLTDLRDPRKPTVPLLPDLERVRVAMLAWEE